jgi:2-C-methyl-D-erythritol 2,4-cyclodiphosphate synthase
MSAVPPPPFATGIGYDVHQFARGRRLCLGGVQIEHEMGLLGHSDADVLLHAVCDALLGAAGLGDIGMHFPNTDPAWKDASSRVLLRIVVERVREQGWHIGNVDVVVLAERPRIKPHVPAMRAAMGEDIGIPPERINVKATTNERMGFVGREEGIAAYATALLYR